MNSEELKPCPFCGKPPVGYEHEDSYLIECQNVLCKVRPDTFELLQEKSEVVKNWNTRADKSAEREEKINAV